MTQKFLDIVFAGKWHHYGHWSACLILCLVADQIMPWYLAGFVGFGIMAFWEGVQWQIDSGWTWKDIFYNTVGVTTFVAIKAAALLLF